MGFYYCDVAPGHPQHGPYHEKEYGFPIRRDAALFERLALEINQAGLSWLTVLKKREAFRSAFEAFELETVAAYGAADRRRLLADAGIIRNRAKVAAVIENARRILALRESHGSFARWLDAHHPRSRERWRRCGCGRRRSRRSGRRARGRVLRRGRGCRGRVVAQSDHFEIAGGQAREGGVQDRVIPSVVVSACHVHVGSVVGNDQAVLLH